MLPPLLKVVAVGSYGAKCAHILRACISARRAHRRVNVRALANVRLHVLLHVLYASSVFSDNALFGFFHMSCFRMLAVRTARSIWVVAVRTAWLICLAAVTLPKVIKGIKILMTKKI